MLSLPSLQEALVTRTTMRFSSSIPVFLALIVALASLAVASGEVSTTHVGEAVNLASTGSNTTSTKGCADSSSHKLGASFTNWAVPHRTSSTVVDKVVFAGVILGVVGIAALVTLQKVRTGEPLPGYTQAVYMKDA